ncbi:HNH endonuclease [Sphingomonas tabacisoli]|uniref:HNH endonuclease n=1 Tax=Sphingomonas tabacisoli TaxID=2249466 RepID=A0ABW4I664_9SPHN
MAEVAWKRLNATDYKNIRGEFAGGSGGGATYIVLGRSRAGQNFADFFPPLTNNRTDVESAEGTFTVSSDPDRRSGEWLIVDQRGNRHPAWSDATDFPEELDDDDNPAVVLIFRSDGKYFTGWLNLDEFEKLAPELAEKIRGVDEAPDALTARFGIGGPSALTDFAEQQPQLPDIPFDPANQEDGRKRIIVEIVRRQGQRAFRTKLLDAFDGKCAMTACAVAWVLEAAHISPYQGPATNQPDNGLLLRADIHTLFDLGLLSVDPDTLAIRVADQIEEAEYRALDGKKLQVGKVAPSKAALQEHWDRSTP